MQHPSGRIVKFAPFSKKKFAHSFTFDQYLYYIYNIYKFSSSFYESYRRSRTFDLPSFCKIRFPNMLHIGGSLRVGKAGGTHALFFKERGPLPLLLFRLSGRGLGVTHRCSWGERWLDKYRDGRPGQKQIITRAGKRARWLAAVPASQDRSNLTLFSGRLSQFSEWLSHHESSGPDYGGELQGARHPAVLRCWFSSLLC